MFLKEMIVRNIIISGVYDLQRSYIIKIIVCAIIIASLELSNGLPVTGLIEKNTHRSTDTIHDTKHLSDTITVPSCVEAGDLMVMDILFDESNQWKVPGPYNEHGGIYIGNNTLIDSGMMYDPDGVYASDYSVFYQAQKNFVFLRVKTANESQKKAAVEWAKNQIGKQYQDFYRFPWFGFKIANTSLPFPTANTFYCMELLWGSYYNQGIDIDQNGWKFPWWVTADDILHDDDVEIIYTEVFNSTEISKPCKGVYVANKKIASTLEKTIVFGSIDIEVVTYNTMITKVDFYIDNQYKATDTTVPYSWTWYERGSGKKVLKAVACDDNGKFYSSQITVQKYF